MFREFFAYSWVALFPLLLVAPLSAEVLPGFEGGAKLVGNQVSHSSPAVADLDGNPDNGLEAVINSANGITSAFYADGSPFWSYETRIRSCSKMGDNNKMFSSPAVFDLDGDGTLEVILTYGGIGSGCAGGITVLNAEDGSRVWRKNLKSLIRRAGIRENLSSVFSTPSVADPDGDGKGEIFIETFARLALFLNHRGKVEWMWTLGDTAWSSASYANIDSDSDLELIVATDISNNDALEVTNGGLLYGVDVVFPKREYAKLKRSKATTRRRRGGRVKKGPPLFGFRDSAMVKWVRQLNQTPFSSPAVGELVSSSSGPEIAIASGYYFPEGTRNKVGKWLKVFDAVTGKPLRTLDIDAPSPASPAIADLNQDGKNEAIVTCSGEANVGGSGAYRVYAYTPEDDALLWEHIGSKEGTMWASPVVGDLDGNGSLEVAFTQNGRLRFLQGSDGTQLHSEKASGSGQSTPTIVDLNSDGIPEVLSGGNRLFAYTPADDIGSEDGAADPYSAPWPTFKRNMSRMGNAEL